jgi:hypothetical protein
MNIELDEVVALDVSDEALEQAAGGAQGGAYDGYGLAVLGPCTPEVSYC